MVGAVDTASASAAPAEAPAAPAAAGMRHGLVLGTTADGVDAYNCNYALNAEEEDPAYDRLSYVVDKRGKTRHAGSKWQVLFTIQSVLAIRISPTIHHDI